MFINEITLNAIVRWIEVGYYDYKKTMFFPDIRKHKDYIDAKLTADGFMDKIVPIEY